MTCIKETLQSLAVSSIVRWQFKTLKTSFLCILRLLLCMTLETPESLYLHPALNFLSIEHNSCKCEVKFTNKGIAQTIVIAWIIP